MSNCKSLRSGWCQQHFHAVASERPALDLLGHDRMGYDGRQQRVHTLRKRETKKGNFNLKFPSSKNNWN
ncbi:hypothetical protein CEXT_676051 [Caerostris extrusa]|uniref:Uncharacterized protein n=1 Tax=Caerostris extrusa TaxID=172846 RepID=A0AAV4PUL2_CAEEX|nr:hypothetical protein CEXT_676051 [Caerostris extrusa]